MADADDLDPHLAARLRETRDVANFSRGPRAAGSDEVERAIALPEHLGGRRIADRFTRSKPGAVPPPPPEPAPGRPPKLEAHLESMLAEVQDARPRFGASAFDQTLEAYRQNRRKLGG